jgi:hypothetical protein
VGAKNWVECLLICHPIHPTVSSSCKERWTCSFSAHFCLVQPMDSRSRSTSSGPPTIYPALHRLERKRWIAAKWESAGKGLKREFKFYRVTPAGKKQLVAEESKWKQMTGAIARIMWPLQEE